jgi:hypothetical protein
VCADEAGTLLGVGDWRRLPKGERAAWMRWGPLVAVLPGIGEWGHEQREALAAVIRAKGGRRETDFVRLFDAHPRLRAAVVALSRGRVTRPAGRTKASSVGMTSQHGPSVGPDSSPAGDLARDTSR